LLCEAPCGLQGLKAFVGIFDYVEDEAEIDDVGWLALTADSMVLVPAERGEAL